MIPAFRYLGKRGLVAVEHAGPRYAAPSGELHAHLRALPGGRLAVLYLPEGVGFTEQHGADLLAACEAGSAR